MSGKKQKKGDFLKLVNKQLTAPEEVTPFKKTKTISDKEPVKKKVELTEEQEAEEISKQFRVIKRSYPSSSVEYDVFYNIPNSQRVTKFTDVGTRVIVAKYPLFHKIYFTKYMEPGLPHFPRGGIKVFNVTQDQHQCFGFDSVALHPTKKDKYRVSIEE